MSAQPKILLLDDDQDFLDLYREMLTQHLPSLPEVKVANSGARGLAMIESEAFNLLIVDLNMPKMDGLQVITIVRRKHPQLRLVVLTAIRDEQFRTRAYGMGVDQYWIKPESDQEMGLFMESIDALISSEAQAGFRGVQSKSLVDIIQLECLSQSSCMLKIVNGPSEGRIYIQNGEVFDAEAPGLSGETAFQRILSWKTGTFETMPADPSRTRTIFTSYQGLLLNTAQAIDEAASEQLIADSAAPVEDSPANPSGAPTTPIMVELSQMEGVEFFLAVGPKKSTPNSWGLDNPKPVADFTRQTLANFRDLGERLQFGELQQVLGNGPQRQVAVTTCGESELCVGFPPTSGPEHVRESLKNILSKWGS
ncbi:MAG TPA: response regulator [Verrucomicrobiae bacterium]|nr:response regulator [Verrucomicrobiae bacterium]